MTAREWVDEYANQYDEELLTVDGHDDAIVGVCRQFNKSFVVYDAHKVIATLRAKGMSQEEAVEFYEFNIVGACVGDATPAFLVFAEASDAH